MRLLPSIAVAAVIAATGAAAAENGEVLTGPMPEWVEPSEPLPVPDDAGGLLFARVQDTLVHLEGGGQSTYFGQRIKILHPQALQAGNLAITWNPAAGAPTVHALRIYRDEAMIDVLESTQFEILRREDQLEAAMLDGLLTATLRVPDLRVGDELEVTFTVPSHDPTMGKDSFGLVVLASSPAPGRFRIGVSWDEGQKPGFRLTPEFAEIAQNGADSLEIRTDNPGILNPPKDAPPRYAWQRVVEYSDFAGWPDVSRRIAALYGTASDLSEASPLKQEAARIAASYDTDLAKAQAALELVQEQVRYIYVGLNGGNLTPATADETWQRRYGDCKGKTVLLLALLAQLGIEAEPVLANNSGIDDGFDQRLPSPGLFDHVLVRATIGGKRYWMDGTLPSVARAGLQPLMPYRWVLPVDAQGAELERVPWEPASLPTEMSLFEIDARTGFDVPSRIEHTSVKRGPEGVVQHAQFSALTQDQLENIFRSQMTGDSTWDTVESVEYRYDPVTQASILRIAGTGPMDWDDDGDGKRSLTLPGGGFSPPGRRQRAADQNQEAPFYNEQEFKCHATTVILPSETDPADWSYNSRFDDVMYGQVYYRAFERREGAIRMIRGFRVQEREIDAETAARDNARLTSFDNSMAWIYYRPDNPSPTDVTQPERVPSVSEIDVTGSAEACLPEYLR
jgi:transglutaminase-like putative cysteine protease